ncbi:hypothetical protein CDL15_Pgr012438 [Punica granatum]|uniref:Uncharacterized protein n=1 Tax=Punica granatum TaxID=22663 RepID=A0A218WYY2_PUNGR|nr:hypothetical protein CDL15_Pgr012438 [Punica granatum]
MPGELRDARALARWVAISTGALPCGLRGARTLARRVLQYARVHYPVDCGVHGHLPGGFCNMQGRIALWIAGCTGACPAGLQYARAHYTLDCGVHERLPVGFAICTGAYLMNLQRAWALARQVCNVHSKVSVKPDCSEVGVKPWLQWSGCETLAAVE